MSGTNAERLGMVVSRFSSCRVLVIGDVMLDVYLRGHARRLSPEAPVPVVVLEQEDHVAGGAANAARNLASLGASVQLVGVVGADAAGRRVCDSIGDGVHPTLITDASRPTTTKTRVVAHDQQVVRVDHEDATEVAPHLELQLVEQARAALRAGIQAVLVSDYAKGVVTAAVARAVIAEASAVDVPVVVDPKGTDFARYRGARIVTPNVDELARATASGSALQDLPGRVERLRHELGGAAVLVTKGAAGMELFEEAGSTAVPALASEVADVTGAGDTVAATVALALAAGATLGEAAVLATLAASVVVRRHGAAAASATELMELLTRGGQGSHGSLDLLDPAGLVEIQLPTGRSGQAQS